MKDSALAKFLFGYVISIFITGFITYLTASLEFTPFESRALVLITDFSILVLFVFSSFRHYIDSKSKHLEGDARYVLEKSR